MNNAPKAIITFHGDATVGIPYTSYELDLSFVANNNEELDETYDKEFIEELREKIRSLYKLGTITGESPIVEFDFEINARIFVEEATANFL